MTDLQKEFNEAWRFFEGGTLNPRCNKEEKSSRRYCAVFARSFCPNFPPGLRDKIRILDDYSLPTRYPDALLNLSHLPQREEAEEAISLAKEAWQWVTTESSIKLT